MTDPTPPGAADPAAQPPDPLFAPPDAWSPAIPYGAPNSGASPYPPPTYGPANLYAPTVHAPPTNTPADPYAQPTYAPPAYAPADPYAPAGYAANSPPGYAADGPAGPGAYPSSPYAFGPGGQPASYPYDYGYGSPYMYPGNPPSRQTDGLAIASLIVSCVSVAGICLWGVACLIGIVGAILGHVARRRIRTTGAGGSGIALAGIIVGWIAGAIGILMITLIVVLGFNGAFDT